MLINRKNNAQSTIELTLALAVIMIFLAGMIKLFGWLGGMMVQRDKNYTNNYVSTYNTPGEVYQPEHLNMVDKQE